MLDASTLCAVNWKIWMQKMICAITIEEEGLKFIFAVFGADIYLYLLPIYITNTSRLGLYDYLFINFCKSSLVKSMLNTVYMGSRCMGNMEGKEQKIVYSEEQTSRNGHSKHGIRYQWLVTKCIKIGKQKRWVGAEHMRVHIA